jgi:FKBP-type peptidyl-prolyl cis-trans isomerase FkpA
MRHRFSLGPATAAAALSAMFALALSSSAMAASAATKGTAAPATPAAAAPAPGSEEEKTLYALGVLISRNLDTFQLTSAEFKSVQAGLVDGFNHHPTLDADTYMQKVQTLQRTRLAAIDEHQKQLGQAYIDKAAASPGAVKTATGMVYIPVTEGTGAIPERSDRVNVNYEGKLIDGTVFDSTAKHGGQPATLGVTGVIPCWTEALQLMKVGGKSRIICPSTLAYGDRGAPPTIPPGATLEFSIELVGIAAKVATPPGPGAPGAPPPGAGNN